MNVQLADIPGLTRAVARMERVEAAWRDLAFLPVGEDICGEPVVQLTLRRLNILIFAQSPFLTRGSRRTAEDVAKFLWVVSPHFDAGRNESGREENRKGIGDFFRSCVPAFLSKKNPPDAKTAFFARVARLDYRRACRAIDRYIDRALLDRPPANARAGGTLIAASFVGILVDRIATAYYGWSDEQILDLPVARLYQYLRLIKMRADPKTPQLSRLSDRARQKKLQRFLAGLTSEPPSPISDLPASTP